MMHMQSNQGITEQGQALYDAMKSCAQQNLQGQRQPEVIAAITRAELLLQNLSSISAEFDKRLESVMRPSGPSNSNQSGQLKAIGAPLADRIDGFANVLESQLDGLRSILGRLEI